MAGKAPPLASLVLLLRFFGPVAAALAAAWALDRLCRRKGLMPPGFHRPWRRAGASLLVFFILWVGIFGPLGELGREQKIDLSTISTPRLFFLHWLMAVTVLGWFLLGFAGIRPAGRSAETRHSRSEGAADGNGDARGYPASAGAAPLPVAPGARVDFEGPQAGPPVRDPGDLPPVPAAQAPASVRGGPALTEPGPPLDSALPGGAEVPGISLPDAGAPAAASGPAVPAAIPRAPSFGRVVAAQLGLLAPGRIPREVAIGLLLGACAWGAVLLALFAAAAAIWAVGGEKALPKPSAIVPWIAALPVLVRVMVSLSAGFVEEIFFRGFLQPRIGIALSTGCFVLAHLSYGQPLMLLGITLLSLIYAFLVRWRQTIWPAIAAHALFDGIQLLFIIPAAMRFLGPSKGTVAAALAATP